MEMVDAFGRKNLLRRWRDEPFRELGRSSLNLCLLSRGVGCEMRICSTLTLKRITKRIKRWTQFFKS